MLVVQRTAAMKLPLKFEFPGGKVEANEILQNAWQIYRVKRTRHLYVGKC